MPMRERPLALLFLAFTVANTGIAVVILSRSEGWPPVDALYFVVTALTTVGFGDLNVGDSPAPTKLYTIYLMLCGAGSYSVLLALAVNGVVRWNLESYFGRRRRALSDHIVLCGLGNLGSRILQDLVEQGENVVVIDPAENRFTQAFERGGGWLIQKDAKLPRVLEEAQVGSARCLIAATDDDLANLEMTLNARELNPGLRIIMRMYDRTLADKVQGAFGIHTVLSASAIAAPAFAHAARDQSITGSLRFHDSSHLICELRVRPGSGLDGMTAAQLTDEGGAALLSLRRGDTEAVQIPATTTRLRPGDELVVDLEASRFSGFLSLNGAR